MTKLQRLVRRRANKVIARRRYRERKSGVLASVWSVRVGPAAPSEKRIKRGEKLRKGLGL